MIGFTVRKINNGFVVELWDSGKMYCFNTEAKLVKALKLAVQDLGEPNENETPTSEVPF